MAISTTYKNANITHGAIRATNTRNMQNRTNELYENDADLETQVADIEAALQDAGKVNTVSVNGGTPVQPDPSKNVNLAISKNTVGLENVTNQNANTLISYHNSQAADTHPDIRTAVATAKSRADEAYTLAEGKSRTATYDNIDDMTTALDAAAKGTFKPGDNLLIVQLDVPDFWVVAENEDKVIFDMPNNWWDLEIPLAAIGYYTISRLETQKVDLSNINAHLANKNNPHQVTKAQVGLGSVVDAGMDAAPTTGSNNYVKSGGVASALAGKENSFTKNSAFNKNFGTAAGTVAQGNDSRIVNAVPKTRKLAGKTLDKDVDLGKLNIDGVEYDGTQDVVILGTELCKVLSYNFSISAWSNSDNTQYGLYMITFSLSAAVVGVYDSMGIERDIQPGAGGSKIYSDVKFDGTWKYLKQ